MPPLEDASEAEEEAYDQATATAEEVRQAVYHRSQVVLVQIVK